MLFGGGVVDRVGAFHLLSVITRKGKQEFNAEILIITVKCKKRNRQWVENRMRNGSQKATFKFVFFKRGFSTLDIVWKKTISISANRTPHKTQHQSKKQLKEDIRPCGSVGEG